MVGDSEIMGNIQKKGITFDNFAELAREHVDIEAFKVQHSSLEQFTDSVIETTLVEDLHMILSYSRKKKGDDHFSPMAAYHKGRDMLLILGVARYKYPFHWLPRMTAYDGEEENLMSQSYGEIDEKCRSEY
ncbi:glutathione gamma-glutamylcysteinyltransferase 3-like [Camellia sinensis]|uniref:glutathione gamma-glutamylcysteinyltransferase 3-like n=1 Tax=Camellia sinensis TaxID=4442 RepID=UPI001036F033|nr:glutathione gamma-glutamylcysteinyltransferase 3-like [Camellia sinensis]